MSQVSKTPKVLSFGEVLWDVFDEDKKIGGAPFNFAAHLVKNGVSAALYSAIGQDALGEEALDRVKQLGVDAQYITLVDKETAVCLVTLNEGTPCYNIKENTAMDHIPFVNLTDTFDGLYFGTLAQRAEGSATTLKSLLKYNFSDVFVDINIRQHYYSAALLEQSLAAATIAKLSREELGALYETGICDEGSYREIACQLKAKYGKLRLIIITLDSDGAYVYDAIADKEYYSEKPACKVVSTVGAGDSFSATFFACVLQGEDIESALRKASRVSTFVVTQLGAIPDYPEGLI